MVVGLLTPDSRGTSSILRAEAACDPVDGPMLGADGPSKLLLEEKRPWLSKPEEELECGIKERLRECALRFTVGMLTLLGIGFVQRRSPRTRAGTVCMCTLCILL